MGDIVRAREAFSYNDENGVPVVVTPGKLVSTDDSGYKGREHLFETVEVRVNTEKAVRGGGKVEDATAAPNEKRSVSTAKTSTPQQKSADDKSVKPTGGITTASIPNKGKGDTK